MKLIIACTHLQRTPADKMALALEVAKLKLDDRFFVITELCAECFGDIIMDTEMADEKVVQ